jgi:hypothetical protein
VVGREEALEILLEVAKVTAPRVTPHWWPAAEEFLGFDDPFGAFRDWMLSLWEADREIGAHDYEIVEDSDKAVQVNVTYCAWYDTYRQLGLGEACQSECHASSVVLPSLCDALGIRHTKTGALSEGAAVCDYRFERIED